jgi:hypothetical protein
VLLTKPCPRHADVFFGDGNRLCIFPHLIECQATLVDRFQLGRLLLDRRLLLSALQATFVAVSARGYLMLNHPE